MPDTISGSLLTSSRLWADGFSEYSTVDVAGDQDWWRIELVAGARYQFDLRAWMGSSLDSYLRLIDASGNVLLTNDDANGSLDAQIRYTASISGTYFLSAQGYGTRVGDYALSATTLGLPPPPPPTVSIFPVQSSQTEGDAGTRAFTFTVTRSSAEGAASVQWAVRHGTTDAADFSGATGGVVSFAAGQTSQTLTLLVAGDRLREVDEAFSVELSAPSGGFLLGTASAAGLIWNDDADIGATLAGAASLAVGSSGTSAIEVGGDQDWWRVDLVAGMRYQFNLNAASGSGLDSYLRLLNASGMELAANDDANGTRNSQMAYTASSSGAYYLSAQGYFTSTGAYTLTAVEVTPTVSISATNASQTEGDAGTKAFTFTVTRSGTGTGSGAVSWAVRHGTTDAGDFSGATSGVVSFAAGETSRTLTVQVAGERMLEGNEGFTVELSAPTGLVLGTASAAGTILNDDTDTVSGTLASTAAIAVGGSVSSAIDYSGDQDWWRVDLVAGMRYQFNLNAASGSGLDSYLRLLNASGMELAANDDANGTLNSQIAYTASSSGTYYLSAQGLSSFSTGAYTLMAAEVTPTVSIAAVNANQAEGDAGTKAFTFTITRSSAVGSGTVNWSVLFGATNEADFSGATSGVVSFAAGETSRTLEVRVVGDMVQESTEVFSVALSGPTGMVLRSASAMGVIGNDDVDVEASTASTAAVAVGGSVSSAIDYGGDQDWWRVNLVAGATYRFNMNAGLDSYLRLLNASGTVLAFNDDANGTLNSQIDYTAVTSGAYYLSAQGLSGFSTGVYTLSAMVVPTVDIMATTASQYEGDAGSQGFTFTVTRSGTGAGSGTVNWAVRHGMTDAADFSGATSGVVSFAAGETSRTVTVQVAGDRMLEGHEGFTVELSAPTGLVLGTASAAGTILNDDTDTVSGTLASTAAIAVGGSVSSAIDYSGDQDWWRVDLVAGMRYQFNLNAASGSGLDSYLRLLNASGMELGANDDANGTRNSQIAYTASSSGTYYLSAQAYGNYSTGAYTLTAAEVTPTVSISATNASQTEGDAGTKGFTFTVTRSSGLGSGTVNWAVRHGTTDAADFSGATSGVVSFAAGEASRTVTVQVAGERMLEGNEGFTVELSAPTGLVLGTASAAGTILNDDTDTVSGTLASTAALAVGTGVGSAIDYSGDQDWWRVNLVAGTTYRFNLNAASGSALDGYLRLLNASGSMLLSNDNTGTSRDAQISWTATTTGVHYLSAQGAGGSVGQYLVRAARTLTGTAAADVFRFATATEGPVDITDFTSGSDRIQVVSRNFGSLPVGTLSSSRLVRGANPVAAGTGAVFLYDTSTGQLTWDSNGALAGGTSVIANLGAGRSLVAGDIRVVAA